MRRQRQYRLTISDEGRLAELGSIKVSRGRIAAALGGFLLLSLALGTGAIWLTPLKTFLPGYMRESQRAASEETMLRLDSLHAAYAQNEAFLNNIAAVLDTDRLPTDSLHASSHSNQLTPDSLMTASPEETKFVRMMQEREKYNISVLAPLAAEGLMFYPPADEAVFSEATRQSHRAEVYLPVGSMVASPADGTVLAVYSPRLDGRYSIVVQHPKNFVSRLSGLGTPLAGEGDHVAGGQAIAVAPSPGSHKAVPVVMELWHNGTPLSPYSYIDTGHGGYDDPETESRPDMTQQR